MSNARILLGAIGEEDGYLTKDAKNTFFKKAYRTHTQFGQNWNIITNNNKNTSGNFGPNSKVYFRLPFEGDLLLNTMLRFKLDVTEYYPLDTTANTDNISAANIGLYTAASFIKKISIKNNDKIIDTLDSNFIVTHQKLHLNSENFTKFTKMSSYLHNKNNRIIDKYLDKTIVYVTLPLPFWFSKSPGSALPMWALTDHNIGIEVELSNYGLPSGLTKFIHDVELLTNYGYLAQSEKIKFKNLPLEYVIEQVDIVEKIKIAANSKLNTKNILPNTHFVKYLAWNLIKDGQIGNYQFDSQPGVIGTNLTFNGNNILANANANFTSLINRYNYFKFPDCDVTKGTLSKTITGKFDQNIHVYSFCLNPMEYKTSGFVSTNKFNKAVLELDIDNTSSNALELCIYQVKHNIIRIEKGVLNILFN
jgi:hypothetical protein